MSSPAPGIHGPGHPLNPQWPNMEAQGAPTPTNIDSSEDGVSVRPMRLKVLYTFDDQNKTNCLARWPQVLQVQTIAMDETTSIGIIELKICIQAIVQASPELVARLGQDYTVYAYDYSEYDNPLVGQGMLSWALAASSPTPDVPAQQSTKLITGRVCKNILGLFTNGVKETLEVKLRLVPVPTVLQSEYVNAMEKYRELSRPTPPGFDPNQWAAFVQSQSNSRPQSNKATPTAGPNAAQRDGVSMEVVNQLLSPGLQQQSMPNPMNQVGNAMDSGNEAPVETTSTEKGNKTSRPSSRASVKRPKKPRQPKKAVPQGGNTSGYEEGTDGDDGPGPRKRAKITKTDWNNKSSLGSAESLRVAASTAGSLRLFRPIAMSPAPPGGSHLQEIPRAPTPIPIAPKASNTPNQHTTHDHAPSQSNQPESSLSQVETSRQHVSPYPPLEKPEDQPRFSIESANTSPERNPSPAETLPDIGSSPPVMRTRPPSTIRSSPPCPSSPVLPQMPRTDSGFMSGSLEDLFGDFNADVQLRDIDEGFQAQNTHFDRQPSLPRHEDSGFMIEEEAPGPMELLPTKMPIIPVPPPPKPKVPKKRPAKSRAGSVMSEDGQQSLPPLRKDSTVSNQPPQGNAPQLAPVRLASQETPVSQLPELQGNSQGPAVQEPRPQTVQPGPHPRSRPGSRMMIRTASAGSLNFPEIPASDPVLPPSTLQRSQTWSETPHPAIEAPVPFPFPQPTQMQSTFNTNMESVIEYSTNGLAKKMQIQSRLETAIANGEMPPYCNNCGAIETPTWRKAWYQDHKGQPGYHEYSDEPGKVTCINILTRNSEGKPESYQLIKKYLAPTEKKEDYKEFILCNPCGIWMSKYKTQRPPEKWDSYEPVPRKGIEAKIRRQQRSKKSQNVPTSDIYFPPSDAYFPQSEANFPQSEAYFPPEPQGGPPEGVSPTDVTGQQTFQAQEERRRSTSSQPGKRLKAMTSDAASAALRRAIQSSPARWQGTRQSPIDVEVEDDPLGSTRRVLFPSPRKDGSPKVLGEVVVNVVTIATEFRSPKEAVMEAVNKENCPPAIAADDADLELLKLFGEEMARPSTPTGKSPAGNAFKTPTRPTPNHRPVTRSVSKSIRSGQSPSQLLVFTQNLSTPSKTPGTARSRRSARHRDAIFESPFTATLNQLMSEAANNNQSPSRNGVALDFENMPDLPNLNGNHDNMSFNMEDFFSTDVPMPSSPPRLFNLYEDPMNMQNMEDIEINWDEFNVLHTEAELEVVVKEEPLESPIKRERPGNEEKEQL